MRIAIMQPYLFPYIGYFQLIQSVDQFIVYDDVTYIKGGWINRNNILLNDKAHLFTIPLVNASSNSLICETQVNYRLPWQSKLLKTVHQAYRKAPNFESIYPLIEQVLDSDRGSISDLAVKSIKACTAYLGIETQILESSAGYGNNHLSAQDRVLDICQIEHAVHYINPIGGMELYSRDTFRNAGVQLNFIKSGEVVYPQFKKPFTPWLSIIDVLMFNDAAATMQLINHYELI